jgi:hypothetical protein
MPLSRAGQNGDILVTVSQKRGSAQNDGSPKAFEQARNFMVGDEGFEP